MLFLHHRVGLLLKARLWPKLRVGIARSQIIDAVETQCEWDWDVWKEEGGG